MKTIPLKLYVAHWKINYSSSLVGWPLGRPQTADLFLVDNKHYEGSQASEYNIATTENRERGGCYILPMHVRYNTTANDTGHLIFQHVWKPLWSCRVRSGILELIRPLERCFAWKLLNQIEPPNTPIHLGSTTRQGGLHSIPSLPGYSLRGILFLFLHSVYDRRYSRWTVAMDS